MAKSRRLHVVNESTLVSDEEVKLMVKACNTQVRAHVAPIWGSRVVVQWHEGDLQSVQAEVPKNDWVIAIMDDPDQAGALGWHWEDDADHIYGEIFARPCIEQGNSTALSGPYAVSSVLSHEVVETLGDPACNVYADTYNGILVAQELCDPVEADVYTITVQDEVGKPADREVTVSNFVTPAWFDTVVSAGEKYDYLGKCKAPFSMTPGGYWVQMPSGQETQKFGDVINWMRKVGFVLQDRSTVVFSPEMPEWLRQLKLQRGRNILKRVGG